MKQAKMGMSQLIAAILILVLIVTVIFIFSPMLDDLKENLGFGIDLTPGEMKAQSKAKEFFETDLKPMIKDCMNKDNIFCFCSDREIAFPSAYLLTFKEDSSNFLLTLSNHLGGKVVEEVFEGVRPIVVDSYSNPRGFTDSGFEIIYSSVSSIHFGDEINIIDLNYTFYKWDNGVLAMLSKTDSEKRRVVETKLC